MSCVEGREEDGESRTKIEVYEFPQECVLEELRLHFEAEPFSARFKTTEEEAWDEERRSFILEFSTKDAAKILTQPVQILDEEDQSEIKLRLRTPSIRQLQLISEKPINSRLIKKCFKKLHLGEVESCEKIGVDRLCHVVTLHSAAEAASLADRQVIQFDETLPIRVQLYMNADHPVGTSRLTSGSMHSTQPSAISSGSQASLQSNRGSLNKADCESLLSQTVSIALSESSASGLSSESMTTPQASDVPFSGEQIFLMPELLTETVRESVSEDQMTVDRNLHHQDGVALGSETSESTERTPDHQNIDEQNPERNEPVEQNPENHKSNEQKPQKRQLGEQNLGEVLPAEQNSAENAPAEQNLGEWLLAEPNQEKQRHDGVYSMKQELDERNPTKQESGENNAKVQKNGRQDPETREHDYQHPETQKPDEQKPETQERDKQKPEAQGPGKQEPETQGPDTEEPETQGLDKQKPETQGPDKQEPETQGPDKQEPETQGPDKQEPETQGPDKQEPETQGPDKQEPETQGPDKQEPETQGPDKQKPETQGPDKQNLKKQRLDGQNSEDLGSGEQNSKTQKPDEQNQETQEPNNQKPEIQKPDDRNPETQEPDDQKPEMHETDKQNLKKQRLDGQNSENLGPGEQNSETQEPDEQNKKNQQSGQQNLEKLRVEEQNSDDDGPAEQNQDKRIPGRRNSETLGFDEQNVEDQDSDGQNSADLAPDKQDPKKHQSGEQNVEEQRPSDPEMIEERLAFLNRDNQNAEKLEHAKSGLVGWQSKEQRQNDQTSVEPARMSQDSKGNQRPDKPCSKDAEDVEGEMVDQHTGKQNPDAQGFTKLQPKDQKPNAQKLDDLTHHKQSPMTQDHAEYRLQDPKLAKQKPDNRKQVESRLDGQTTVAHRFKRQAPGKHNVEKPMLFEQEPGNHKEQELDVQELAELSQKGRKVVTQNPAHNKQNSLELELAEEPPQLLAQGSFGEKSAGTRPEDIQSDNQNSKEMKDVHSSKEVFKPEEMRPEYPRLVKSSIKSEKPDARKQVEQKTGNKHPEEPSPNKLSVSNPRPNERTSAVPTPVKRVSLQQRHEKPVPAKRVSKAKSAVLAQATEMHAEVEATDKMSTAPSGPIAIFPSNDSERIASGSARLSLSIESLVEDEPSIRQPTHVEIEVLSNTSTDDMYGLLELHLCEVMGDQFAVTKLQHSYDRSKEVFRFDMSVDEAEKLLNTKQMIFEDEDDSTLTIRPLYTGKTVVMKVVEKPAHAGLSKAHLLLHFGEKGPFCSTVSVTQIKSLTAIMETESCSLASLIVSMGRHILDNQIVLKASFPPAQKNRTNVLEPPSAAANGEDDNTTQSRRSVLLETSMSEVMVKKFIKTKSKGTLTRTLSEGRYLVEYDTDQAAQEMVEQTHKFADKQMKTSFYAPGEDEDVVEGGQETDGESVEGAGAVSKSSSGSGRQKFTYSREFLLEFKDFHDISAFAGVIFPPQIVSPAAAVRQQQLRTTPSSDGAAQLEVVEGPHSRKTLIVSNLLDCDAQTLFFWVKTVFGVWPISVQVAASEEKAVIHVPAEPVIDERKLRVAVSDVNFQLHGEKLDVKMVAPTKSVQVICSPRKADAVIDESTLEMYFSNPRFAGVSHTSSLQHITKSGDVDATPVYVITYSHPQDVQNVISKKKLQHGDWTFDVAENYRDVGLCSPGSVTVFEDIGSLEAEVKQAPKTPKLYINDVDLTNVDETLKMFMSRRKHCDGGEIDSWKVKPSSTDLHRVQVTYKDPQVAERVYRTYQQRGLTYKNQVLDLELEMPSLTEDHDDKKVRVSGLTNELDPEKLKFYLSALSDNVVIEMFFDESQTRAVALFKHSLAEGLGDLVALQHLVSLEGYPELKVSPEFKCGSLIATGDDLCKEEIEVQIESLLEAKYKREVDVHADEYPGTTDMWRIVTEPQVLPYILEKKDTIRRLNSLDPLSEFLGIHVTVGFHKKKEDIANLISDPLMLEFLCKSQSMLKAVHDHLKGMGMVLLDDGVITINSTSDKKEYKTALGNWRLLRENFEKFVKRRTLQFNTGPLTQQVLTKVKDSLSKLVSGVSVIWKVKGDNELVFVGERNAVEETRARFDWMVKQIEDAILEEQSIIQVTVPNISGYQADYLSLVRFFEGMCAQNRLKSFRINTATQCVAIQGLPKQIDQVQKEMFALLPKISNSKVSVTKKAKFLSVFKTESASQSFRQQLLLNNISAVWVVENKTISVYSESKETSQSAVNCMNKVVWEGSYPNDRDFDELEMKLLQSSLWKSKKATLMETCQPLELVDPVGQGRLVMYGLAQTKPIVIEEIPYFFETNVERTGALEGVKGRIHFLNKYKQDVLKNLSQQHNVRIQATHDANGLEIIGTVDDIANCQRSCKYYHDLVCTDTHVINHVALVQHINEDRELLDTVGLKTGCLVVIHQEEAEPAPAAPILYSGRGAAIIHFTMKLSSTVVCEGQQGDITSINCDAIVNAANGDLQHVGGLAHAIVQRGGSSIQQECTNFIRRNGQLMDGEVFTSSPGTLSCKKVIHAVGPRWKGGQSGEELALYSCIDNIFDEMKKHKLGSVAIPPISTGIFGYPLEKAVKTIVEVVSDRAQRGDYLPPKIIFADNQVTSMEHFQRQLAEKFQKSSSTPAAFQRVPQGPLAAAPRTQSTKYTVNGRNILVLNKLNIEIKHGDITAAQEESLVNSAGKELNLSQGMIAQALLRKAGPQLQMACNNIAPLNVCEVKETDGFGLPCQKVLHCICPGWKGTQTLAHLKIVVTRCLKLAASFGHTSIAFPALGTGNLRYPVDAAAEAMVAAVVDYATKNPNSSLRDVKIVIYYADNITQKAFDTVLQQMAKGGNGAASLDLTPKNIARNTSAQQSDANMKGCVQVNDTYVRVIQGDLANHKADMLVNSTDSHLSVNGEVSRALLKRAGQSVKQEIDMLRLNASTGGIWVSSAGQLNARGILHIDSGLAQGTEHGWEQLISNCLAHCDQNRMTSIAFPAIGTGALKMDAKQMAKIILKAVASYLTKNPQSIFRKVDVVIYRADMVDDFVSSLKKCAQKKGPWWSLPLKAFNFIASKLGSTADTGGASYDPITEKSTGTLRVSEDGPDAELVLDIYGDSKEDIKRCKENLEKTLGNLMSTQMWKSKPTYTEDRENIAKLTKEQVDKLSYLARELNVKMTIDRKVCDIRLNGLTESVYKMAEHITAQLKGIDKEVQELKEAVLMAKTVQWVFDNGAGGFSKFEHTINKRIEEVYQDNPQGSFTYETEDDKVRIDLTKMQGRTSTTTFEIKREDLQATIASQLKVPDTWQAPKDVYKEFPLTAATPEYQAVERNFVNTLGQGGNQVLEIRRIQNPVLYEQFTIIRRDAAKRLARTEDKVETILWHGTDAATVPKIAVGKFDRAMAGKNATMYGTGTYFAATSAYSARYAAPDPQGHKYMIQTRVVTGEWAQGNSALKSAPYKNNTMEQYDSVVDNVNNPNIYVVFNDASAYPEYIVKFL